MIVSTTVGYLKVIYRHYEPEIVVFYSVILYTIIESMSGAGFYDMEMGEVEKRQRMQEMRSRFPEYSDFDHDRLARERDRLLSGGDQRSDKEDRLEYVRYRLGRLEQPVQAETSFNNDGPPTSQTSDVQVGESKPLVVSRIERLIARKFNRPGFSFTSGDNDDISIRLDLLNTETSTPGNLKFSPKGKKGGNIKSQVVLNWNKETGDYEFNDGRGSKEINEAVKQFKEKLGVYVEKYDESRRNENIGIMVDTRQHADSALAEEADLDKVIEEAKALKRELSKTKKALELTTRRLAITEESLEATRRQLAERGGALEDLEATKDRLEEIEGLWNATRTQLSRRGRARKKASRTRKAHKRNKARDGTWTTTK